MTHKHKIVMFFAATIFVASGFAVAAEKEAPAAGKPGMEQMPMRHDMMGGGTMGMMDMMHGCNRMMNAGMMGGAMMPQLPPGNEKMQLQMQAEIMQKVGEIVAKYAGKVKE